MMEDLSRFCWEKIKKVGVTRGQTIVWHREIVVDTGIEFEIEVKDNYWDVSIFLLFCSFDEIFSLFSHYLWNMKSNSFFNS